MLSWPSELLGVKRTLVQVYSRDKIFLTASADYLSWGASGPVIIDGETGGRFHNSTPYFLINSQIVEDGEGMVSPIFEEAAEYRIENASGTVRWFDVGAGFNYSDFSAVAPPSLPVLTQEYSFNQVSFFLFQVIGASIMFMAFCFALWTWTFRNSRVVKASQPIFLLLICLGCFFMGFCAIVMTASAPPQSYQWANFSCMASYWSFCCGFGLAFSALFSKTWRINKVSITIVCS